MKPFRTSDGKFRRSLAIDASTIGDTTVTVGVDTTRNQEIDILDLIYRHGEEQFKPFYHKANDLGSDVDPSFVPDLLRANDEYLQAFAHQHSGPVRDDHGAESGFVPLRGL